MDPEQGDSVRARVLKAALEGLADGRDPILRDLAADVLAGRLSDA